MKYMIDPPSGWQYGFPKAVPFEVWEGNMEVLLAYLKDNGYPEKMLPQAKHTRYWIDNND